MKKERTRERRQERNKKGKRGRKKERVEREMILPNYENVKNGKFDTSEQVEQLTGNYNLLIFLQLVKIIL